MIGRRGDHEGASKMAGGRSVLCHNSLVSRRDDHPTRLALIECGLKLAEQHGLHGFTVDMLLTESGISKGSLYHHFEDFIDLLETVQVRQYAENIALSIAQIEGALSNIGSKEGLRAAFYAVAEAAHSKANADARVKRAHMIGSTPGREKFAYQLGIEQDRLRDSLAALIASGQERGFVQRHSEPKALATFVLAYAQGLIVNDIAVNPIDYRDYVDIVKQFVDVMVIASS